MFLGRGRPWPALIGARQAAPLQNHFFNTNTASNRKLPVGGTNPHMRNRMGWFKRVFLAVGGFAFDLFLTRIEEVIKEKIRM